MKKIIVGITGASGVVYGIRCLELLSQYAETHLIITEHARQTIAIETDISVEKIQQMAYASYLEDDFTAAIASGSFLVDSMIIIPCSIKTLSAIVYSSNNSLMVRAADVIRKEKRRLILGVREMPFHSGHLRLMLRLAHEGVIICPPVPCFYGKPESFNAIIDTVIARYLDLLMIPHAIANRWSGIGTNDCLHSTKEVM